MDTLPLPIPERRTLKIRHGKSFYQKLNLHTQNGDINQVANREITQCFGFHMRKQPY